MTSLFSVVLSHPDRSVSEIVRTYRTDFHPLFYPLLVHGWLLVARDRRGGRAFQRLLERRYRRVETRSFRASAAEYWVPRGAPGETSPTP